MDWMMILQHFKDVSWLLFKIMLYLVPFMIVMEIFRHSEQLQKFSHWFSRFLKPLGFSSAAVMPLFIGLVFGLTYGSGTIIQYSREGVLTEKDKKRLTTFLNICHAVPEDTLLFYFIGASFFLIAIPRLLAGYLVTYLTEKFNL